MGDATTLHEGRIVERVGGTSPIGQALFQSLAPRSSEASLGGSLLLRIPDRLCVCDPLIRLQAQGSCQSFPVNGTSHDGG